MVMPIPAGSGTGTLSINTNHLYTTNGLLLPTLTLVGNDGATTVVTDTTAPEPTLLISSTPPTVSISFNTTTNILTAVFSEDVGTALVGQVDSNDAPLGDPLWSDGATAGGSFANDLDIRVDSTGASLPSPAIPSATTPRTSPRPGTWREYPASAPVPPLTPPGYSPT